MIISSTRDRSVGNSTCSRKKMRSRLLVPAKIKLAKLSISRKTPQEAWKNPRYKNRTAKYTGILTDIPTLLNQHSMFRHTMIIRKQGAKPKNEEKKVSYLFLEET